jgi:tetratricopeptide (TPR) repeat protein
LLIALGLVAFTLAAYVNCFDAGFALDNRGLILQDPRLRAATAENLGLILSHNYWWPTGESGLYRPFTTLSYLFNYSVLGNGEHAAAYHAINLLLHGLNVLLVYVLARRFLPGIAPPAALAGLWAVHPALTESVTNIIGRSDLLAGSALLSGFWFYLKSMEASGRRRLAWLGGLAAVTTVGVFSKESAVAILGVIAVYELLWRRQRLHVLPVAAAAVLLPVLAMWWARSRVLGASPPAVFAFTDNPLVGAGFWQAKLTALAVLGRYIWLTVWPLRLSADYSFAQIPLAQGSVVDWAAWLTVAAALAIAAFFYRRSRAISFFLLFAFVNLAPSSNLLFPIGTIMADRLLYLPSLGLFACIVMAVCRLFRYRAAAAVVLALAAAVFAARTYARNADWRDDLSLASADVEAAPGSFKTHYRLAGALYESESSHADLDRVIGEAEKSLSILDALPDSRNTPGVYRSAGGYYLEKGKRLAGGAPPGETTPAARKAYERSIQLLERCLSIIAALRRNGFEPSLSDEAAASRMLSAGYLELSEIPQALASALEARRLEPLSPQNYWQLFNIFISQERAFEAATVLTEGAVVTGDASMRQELIHLYRMGLDAKGCAVSSATGALDPACETVQKQLCAAAADLDRLSHESRRPDIATQLNQIPVSGCPVAGR